MLQASFARPCKSFTVLRRVRNCQRYYYYYYLISAYRGIKNSKYKCKKPKFIKNSKNSLFCQIYNVLYHRYMLSRMLKAL